MSGNIKVNRITNANVYVNGNCLLGRVEEIKLPSIKIKSTEHKALGMVGTIELPSGFDKLEGSVKWNSFYEDVWLQTIDPFTAVSMMARSSVDTYDNGGRTVQRALVTYLTVLFKDMALGEFKQHDNAEFPASFGCTYIKQQIDGRDIIELDVMANIFKIDGKDKLDLYRANIGG